MLIQINHQRTLTQIFLRGIFLNALEYQKYFKYQRDAQLQVFAAEDVAKYEFTIVSCAYIIGQRKILGKY